MALKAKISKDDHAKLPDALKEHYVERDGSFVLETDGLVDRSALDKERADRAAATRQFQELKDKIGDLDPVKAREALAMVQQLADKKLLDEGKVDELIAARTAAMTADHENQVKAFKGQLSEKDAALANVTSELEKLTIHTALRTLALEKGVRKEALDDVIARFTVTGVDGIKWGLKDGKVVAMKGDQIAYGKDASSSMPFDEGLALLTTRAPHLFEPSQGSGAANAGRGTGSGGHTISSEAAKDPQQYQAARAAAEKAGQTLTVQ